MNDQKHVDWAGLKYYDAQIKKYVNDIVEKVREENASDEELAKLTTQVNNIIVTVTDNRAKIDELFNNDAERLARINDLLASDKVQGENIQELQTRIDALATKEEVETLRGDHKVFFDDIVELEKNVIRDHDLIEQLLVAVAGKVSKEYVDSAIANLPQVNLENYATKDYVLEKINDAVLSGDVDLTNYYNKETVDAKFGDVETKIGNNSARIDELVRFNVNQDKNLDALRQSLSSDYYTKSETDSKITEAINSIDFPETDLSDYYTKDEVDKLIPDDFATKSDIDVLNDAVAQVEELLDEKADVTDLTGLATEEFVVKKIAEAELADQDVDLSAYYTKSEVDALIPDVSEFVTNDTFNTTVNNIAEQINNIEQDYTTLNETVQNISNNYVTEEELNNYTTTEQLEATYVTQQTLEEKNYITTSDATTKIEQIVEEKVQEVVTSDSLTYDTF